MANPAVGYAHYRDTAAVSSYLAMPQVREMLPANLRFCWSVKSIDEKEQYYQLVALKSSTGGRPALEGERYQRCSRRLRSVDKCACRKHVDECRRYQNLGSTYA